MRVLKGTSSYEGIFITQIYTHTNPKQVRTAFGKNSFKCLKSEKVENIFSFYKIKTLWK